MPKKKYMCKKTKKNGVNINIYLKKKKKKNNYNNNANNKNVSVVNKNAFIYKIKKILKIFIILLFLLYLTLVIRTIYCKIKANKLNRMLDDEVNDIFNNLIFNLKSLISDTIKINSNKLSLSQTLNINEILKKCADKINKNIIDKDNGIMIDDENIGIYKNYCKNYKVIKNIGKKINIKNFFINIENRLAEKKYTVEYNSIDFIKNIHEFLKYNF